MSIYKNIILVLLVTPALSYASPSNSKNVYRALKQSDQNWKSSVAVENPHIDTLSGIGMNKRIDRQVRWRAIVAAMGLNQSTSRKKLIKNIVNSNDWFLKNALLVGARELPRNNALAVAKLLLNDKSLLVRTEAVKLIGFHKGVELRKDLRLSLNNPINFKHGKPLWVHRHIKNVLAEM